MDGHQYVNVRGHDYNVDVVLHKDIVIIGGGSAGTYVAIRAKDAGKDVLVVEEKDRLGGHTQTYVSPDNGIEVDIGVKVFHNLPVVTNYFDRLNVSYSTTFVPQQTEGEFVEFSSGKQYGQKINLNTLRLQALGLYSYLARRYRYLDDGYNLPFPVPADLFLPFGEFVKRYNLSLMAYFAWQFAHGVGDILQVPTIYVLKVYGDTFLTSLKKGFLTTTPKNNSLIYQSAANILRNDVLYSSTVIDMDRRSGRITLIVKNHNKLTLIRTKKLVISIQPTLKNLESVDLTEGEKSIFGKFRHTQYFSGLLKNSGIPWGSRLNGVSPLLDYHIPVSPAIYSIQQTANPDLMAVLFYSTQEISDADIKAIIISQVKKIEVEGMISNEPEFVEGIDHQPFQLQVSSSDIQAGFYLNLLSLQGKKRTWYISATFSSHDSSLIWQYAETLMPALLE